MEWTDLPDDYGKTPDGKFYEKHPPLDWDKLFDSVAREMARQADAHREDLNKRVTDNFNLYVAQAERHIVKQRVEELLYDIMGPRSYCIPNPSERGG